MTNVRFTPRIAALVTAILVVLLGGGAATAAWTKLDTGSGAVAVNSLTAPSPSAAKSGTNPSTSIVVTWTATTGLPAVSYTVLRGTTPLSGCSTTSCTDTGLSPGTQYNYTVTTTLQGWAKSGAASATTDQAATSPGMAAQPPSGTAFGSQGWKNGSAACDPQSAGSGSSRLCITPVSNGAAIDTSAGLVTYRLERLNGSNGTVQDCYTASTTSGSAGSWTPGSSCSTNPMTYDSAAIQFRSLQIPQTDVKSTQTQFYRWTVAGLRDINGVIAPAQSFTFNVG
jgi:hypothetical protein